MRYLCFDIECCDGVHICEFGYVITDTKFNVIEKQVILINPENKFRLTGRVGQKDLKLYFTEEEYNNSPTFPYYYNQIKELISYPDQIIIGHAINNDAKFLNTACKRYQLGALDFNFFDSQKAYQEYSRFHDISLENAGEELGIEKPTYLHKSDDDALLTMEVMEALCKHMDASLSELRELCSESCGINKDFYPRYVGSSLVDKLNKLALNPDLLSNGKKKKTILELTKRVQPKGKIRKSNLNKKQLCFSTSYEKEHLKETLIFIQLLANNDCKYSSKVSDNDYYVTTEEELNTKAEDEHSRYYAATEIKDDGRRVKVMSFSEMCQMLGVTYEDIENMKWPKADYFNINRRSHSNSTSTKKANCTIGEINRGVFQQILEQLKAEE